MGTQLQSRKAVSWEFTTQNFLPSDVSSEKSVFVGFSSQVRMSSQMGHIQSLLYYIFLDFKGLEYASSL